MVFCPMVPFLGKNRQKKMITTETATPASSPADNTSGCPRQSRMKNVIWNVARTVVLRPPCEVTTADNVVEDKPSNAPGHVVRRCCRGNETSSAEYDRPVDVTNESVGIPQLDEVLDQGAKEADEEEKDQSVIDLSLGELARGTNNSPNDGCSTEDLSGRASKAVLLPGLAHVRNIGEHPRLNSQLHGSRNDCRNYLGPEHGTWTSQRLDCSDRQTCATLTEFSYNGPT